MSNTMRETTLEERERDAVRSVVLKQVPVEDKGGNYVSFPKGAQTEDLLVAIRALGMEADSRGESIQRLEKQRDSARQDSYKLQSALVQADGILLALIGDKEGVPKPVILEAVTALLKDRKVAMPDPGPRRDALVYRTIVVALSDYLKAVRGR